VRDVDASEEIAAKVVSASEDAEVIVLAVREEMTALSSAVDPLVREDADSALPRREVLPEEMPNPPSAEEEAVVLPLNKFSRICCGQWISTGWRWRINRDESRIV